MPPTVLLTLRPAELWATWMVIASIALLTVVVASIALWLSLATARHERDATDVDR